ncbi:unnamed protein product [Ilex paraguariensis]|uniref:B30.2/SPRY domain-containing protein n=1 Tax=Ilex paraguariensis TaxID=185542 RepID=A0ABC8QY22_9AQUA
MVNGQWNSDVWVELLKMLYWWRFSLGGVLRDRRYMVKGQWWWVGAPRDGWEANSYGYHGDDGLLYRGQGKGEAFGPTYTADDTVGGGINYASQELFFTKNGAVVGTVYKDVKGPLFPTIAVHSQNEEYVAPPSFVTPSYMYIFEFLSFIIQANLEVVGSRLGARR